MPSLPNRNAACKLTARKQLWQRFFSDTLRRVADERTIRAVIFDMDGVLTDSEPLISTAAMAMFKEKGLTVQTDDFRPFVGAGEDRYIGGVAEKYNFALDVSSAKKRTYEIYLELVPSRLNAFSGAVELVRACRNAGLKVAVASSADRIKLNANLEKIVLPPEMWDAIVTAEDVAHNKPAPDLFLAATRKLGLTPEQCVVIEDAVNGVQAAKLAGMRCVAVAQSFPSEQLQAADLVKGRISDVFLADLVGGVEPITQGRPPPFPAIAAPRPWGFWTTLGFAVAIAAAFVGAQIVVGMIFSVVVMSSGHGDILTDPKKLQTSGLFLALATCGAAPVGIGLTWLFAWIRKGISVFDYLGLKRVPTKQLVRWCIALLALGVLSDGLSTLLGRPLVPEVIVESYKTAWFPPLFWFAIIVLAPLNEEIFFRGFLFVGLSRSRMGSQGAILLTSLLWSVVHFQYDWYGVASIFASGLLLGYARMKTNSIIPAILMHSLLNLVATIQVAILIRFVDTGT